jgi:hypothetical protein
MTAKRKAGPNTRATDPRKMGGKHSSLSNIQKTLPPPEEWDFRKGKVPDKQLLACYIHEFSRERLFRDSSLGRAFDGLDRKTWLALFYRFRTSRGTPVFTLLNRPWQCLEERERVEISEGQASRILPTENKPATFGDTRPFAEITGRGLFAELFIFRAKDDSSVEYGAFSIDWSYPPKVLVKEFAQWVDRQIKERREGKSAEELERQRESRRIMKQVGFIESDELKPPRPLPPITKDRRGKGDYVTLRMRLRSLGAIRVRRVIDNIQDAICAVQNVPGAQPPYVEVHDWYRAKGRVDEALSDLLSGSEPKRKTRVSEPAS